MSVESLIYLVVWVIAVLGVAYAITYALGNAGMPQIVIAGVWLIASLILLLLLLQPVVAMAQNTHTIVQKGRRFSVPEITIRRGESREQAVDENGDDRAQERTGDNGEHEDHAPPFRRRFASRE